MVGDNQVFGPAPGKETNSQYSAWVLKNLRWPGSLTVYKVKSKK